MNNKFLAREFIYLFLFFAGGITLIPFIFVILSGSFEIAMGFYVALFSFGWEGSIIWLLVFFPYLMFQFVRVISWAGKRAEKLIDNL
jgi:hypothetical protein